MHDLKRTEKSPADQLATLTSVRHAILRALHRFQLRPGVPMGAAGKVLVTLDTVPEYLIRAELPLDVGTGANFSDEMHNLVVSGLVAQEQRLPTDGMRALPPPYSHLDKCGTDTVFRASAMPAPPFHYDNELGDRVEVTHEGHALIVRRKGGRQAGWPFDKRQPHYKATPEGIRIASGVGAKDSHFDAAAVNMDQTDAPPEQWLRQRAARIRKLVTSPGGMKRFRHRVLKWAEDRAKQLKEIDRWEADRHAHEARVRDDPRLRDEKAGPPEPGWQFEFYPKWRHSSAKACRVSGGKELDVPYTANESICGWTPPNLLRYDWPEYELPLPLSERSLAIVEKYVVLGAIHDGVYRGVELISPWLAIEAPNDRVDTVKFQATGQVYTDLIEQARRIPRDAKESIDALLGDVEADAGVVAPEAANSEQESARPESEWSKLAGETGKSEAAASANEPQKRDQYSLRRIGGFWELTYEGERKMVAHLVGVEYLYRLIRIHYDGNEKGIHVHDLATTARGVAVANAPPGTDSGPIIDLSGRRVSEARIKQIDRELQDARDPADIADLRDEKESIERELAKAMGIGGRERKLGDHLNTQRTSVKNAISRAIEKISTAHPHLGQHLKESVETGMTCRYNPRQSPAWQF